MAVTVWRRLKPELRRGRLEDFKQSLQDRERIGTIGQTVTLALLSFITGRDIADCQAVAKTLSLEDRIKALQSTAADVVYNPDGAARGGSARASDDRLDLKAEYKVTHA